MAGLAGAELRLEHESAVGDDAEARLHAFQNFDPAAASRTDRHRNGLEAALYLHEHDVPTFERLDRFFRKHDAPVGRRAARNDADANGLPLGKPRRCARRVEHQRSGSALGIERRRCRANHRVHGAAARELDDGRSARPNALSIFGRHRRFYLYPVGIDDVKQLGAGEYIGAKPGIHPCDAAIDEAGQREITAVSGDVGGVRRRLRPAKLGFGYGEGRLRSLEILPCRNLGFVEALFARISGAGCLRARRRGASFGRDGGCFPALQERDGLAGTDGISKSLVDSYDSPVGRCGQFRFTSGRGGDGGLRDNLTRERARLDFRGSDFAGLQLGRSEGDKAFAMTLFLAFFVMFGGAGFRRWPLAVGLRYDNAADDDHG